MFALPEALSRAIENELTGYERADLASAARALSERYLADHPARGPIISDQLRAAAYLLTRMPATYAAARAALRELALALPGWRPEGVIDLGAGTGAASWAAVAELNSVRTVQVVDYADAALDLATRLLADAPVQLVRRQRRLGEGGGYRPAAAADLAMAAYVLSELTPAEQDGVVTELMHSAPVILLLEPGTPAGYRRILRVRERLIEAGWTIAAPCPHARACPLTGADWCHMSVRLPRSVAHRQAKGGRRDFEDEKFSYLAATTLPVTGVGDRILRHPQVRPGHVLLQLCTTAGLAEQKTVSKRQGPAYKQARKVEWGDAWPPSSGGSRQTGGQ